MDRAVAFYRETLGLTPGTLSQWWSDFDLGGVKIGLHPPFQSPPPGGNGWILGLEVDDLRALRNALAEAGFPATKPFHDVPGGAILEFADPDGNPIQAIQIGAKAADLA